MRKRMRIRIRVRVGIRIVVEILFTAGEVREDTIPDI